MKLKFILFITIMTVISILSLGCKKDNKETNEPIESPEETEEVSLPPAGDDNDIHGVTGDDNSGLILMYTTEDVNVRYLPTMESEILLTLPAGTRVMVYGYEEGDEWCKTFLFNEDAYYIKAEFLSIETFEPSEEESFESTGEPLEGDEEYVMYTTSRLNVRTSPSMSGEVLTTLNIGDEVMVHTKGSTTNWYLITKGDLIGFANSHYLSTEKSVVSSNVDKIDTSYLAQDIATWSYTERSTSAQKNVIATEFKYYGIYSGSGWHFTPEQIDDAWRYVVGGEVKHRSNKPHMDEGTTRAWQEYLYAKLDENGLSWFYKIACAQAMQESGFNPLNMASIDHGLFSFRRTFWNNAYGDIYDYHCNINAYVDRIKKYLIGATSLQDVYLAISQHFNPNGQIHMGYVNSVLSHLEELWER